MLARRPASILALVFALQATAGAAESVTDRLRRQTQELVDAITTGTAAVWDRYLHPDVRFTGFAERREAWDVVWKRL